MLGNWLKTFMLMAATVALFSAMGASIDGFGELLWRWQ